MSRILLSTPYLTPRDVGREAVTGTNPHGPQATARMTERPATSRTTATPSLTYEDPDVRVGQQAKREFLSRFASVAKDPRAFGDLFAKVYGSHDRKSAEQIRQQTLRGDASWLPEVRFLQRENLQGANGAYSARENTVYLSRDLQENRSLLARTFSEEVGHHIDSKVRNTDRPGDEGEMFRRLLGGERLTRSEERSIRSENDHGVVSVDGKPVEVEFFLGKVKKAFKKAAHAVTNVVKRTAQTISRVATKTTEAVTNVVKKTTQAVSNVATKTTHSISTLAKGAVRSVAGAVQPIARVVGNAARAVTRSVGTLGRTVSRTVSGVAGGVLRTAARTLRGFSRSAIRGLSGITGPTRDLLRGLGTTLVTVLKALGLGMRNSALRPFELIAGSVLDRLSSGPRSLLDRAGRATGIRG